MQLGINWSTSGVKAEHRTEYMMLWVATCLAFFGTGLTVPQFSVRIVDQGINLQQFGVLQAAATVVSIIVQVTIGKYSDRIGRRKPLLIGALLLLLPALSLFPHAKSALAFGLLLSLHQLASNTVNGMISPWVSTWAKEGQMGRVHGSFRISCSVGWIMATGLLGVIMDRFGLAFAFYLGVAVSLLAAVVILFGTRDHNKLRSEAVADRQQKSLQYVWPAKLKMLFVALGVFMLAQQMGFHLNFIFFAREMGVSNTEFGLLSSIQAWPEIPLMLFFGIISDRIKVANILSIGMVIAGLRWFLFAIATSPVTLFFAQPLHAVGVTVSEVLIVAFVARMVPERYLGAVIGWKITVMSLSRFTAPLLAGVIGDFYGIRLVFTLSGILAVL